MHIPNYHSHTTFCDGKNTPEQMVQAAIAAGCPALGFSGHGYTAFDPSYCMNPVSTRQYCQEILRLREKYAGQIRILLGVERDYFGEEPQGPFDYVIGSVHYLYKDGVYLPVDESAEALRQAAENHYGGDLYSLIEDYFRLVADVPRKTHCQIVGHFDLITKFSEQCPLFDEAHPRYRAAAGAALDTLLRQGALLEINTGAISRGYRTTPYPADWVLRRMGQQVARAILSSDCHSADAICCGFVQAAKLAADCGVTLVDSPL